MNAPFSEQLRALDARQPWYVPYAAGICAGQAALQAEGSAAAALSAAAQGAGAEGLPAFVAASAQPPGEAYEAFIARTGSVPTRDKLHDWFNGLVWLEFSQAKRRLNELQSAEIARCGIGPVRGPVRDALTLFDENGAVLAAPAALWEALVLRDWRRLFVQLRPLWQEATLIVFGHALLDKLARPRKDLTAHVWAANAAGARTGSLDGWLAAQLTGQRLAAKPFTPLPLLGVPGWWPGNEDVSFYDDARVFRPAGRAAAGRPNAARRSGP